MASSLTHWIAFWLVLALSFGRAASDEDATTKDEAQSCSASSVDNGSARGESVINATLWKIPNKDLTAEERETKLNQLIEDTELQWSRRKPSKEQKLFKMLEDWNSAYAPKGKAGLEEWYELAKQEVFTFKGMERNKEEDGTEWKYDDEKGAELLYLLEQWSSIFEDLASFALSVFYGEVAHVVFGLPEVEYSEDLCYQDSDEDFSDPKDAWRGSWCIDSHHGTHVDLGTHFGCDSEDGPVGVDPHAYNEPFLWRFLRYHYAGIVGPEKSSLYSMEGSGFLVDVEFDYAEGKGRGVFAKDFIPKNTLVSNSSQYFANFDNGVDFRRFITSLPPNMACDCLQWTYVEAEDEFDPNTLRISVDTDGQGLVNNGNHNTDDEGRYVNLHEVPRTGVYFATRDIQAKEELQIDYDEFQTRYYRWEHFGL